MCKFHKDVARDIATDHTGTLNPARYAVALTAMAKFRIEQYMPAMHGCDGFTPAEMITEKARIALLQSGLSFTAAEIKTYRDAHIGRLRAAMDGIKTGTLDLPPLPADPATAGPFLDEAVVQLFDGYDDIAKAWARSALSLTPQAHKQAFEPLRAAVQDFLSQPGIEPILHQMFAHSLVRVFEDARTASAVPQQSKGCVMCGHGSRAPKPAGP